MDLPDIQKMVDDANKNMFGSFKSNKIKKKKTTTKKTTKKNEFKLTSSTIRNIKGFVKKCEHCGKKNSLEIHHIDNNHSNNVPSNIIVLSHECHKDKAQRGPLSVSRQKEIVKNRSKEVKEGIKVILDKSMKNQQKSKTHIKKSPIKKTPKKKPPIKKNIVEAMGNKADRIVKQYLG